MAKTKSRRPAGQKRKQIDFFATRGWIIPALVVFIPLGLAGVTGFTAMQFENHDSFCASCHSQPDSDYYQRESAAAPVDLATFHAGKSVRCIDCHSGSGILGRPSALMLGAHDLMAYISKNYPQPAPLTRPISDGSCLKCHSDVPLRQDFNNHFHFFLAKWQSMDPQAAHCVDCHKSHSTQVDASAGFMNQDTTLQVCQKCHNFAGAGGN